FMVVSFWVSVRVHGCLFLVSVQVRGCLFLGLCASSWMSLFGSLCEF
ncbi:12780_t:CDS:1, partial [Gigaspora rosea]